MTTTALATMPDNTGSLSIANTGAFEHIQRVAKCLTESQLVPVTFQRNLPNVVVALELASRVGASPIMVMQNLNVIHGRPSWSSQFIIAAVNATRRFKPLRFDTTGEGDARQCVCWTVENDVELPPNARTLDAARKAGLPVLDSVAVTIAMAKKEGWFDKKGSKWQTMPDLMLRYRAATFFGRMYAPEVLMGLHTEEEALDIPTTTVATEPEPDVTPDVKRRRRTDKGINAMEPKNVTGSAESPSEAACPANTENASSETSKTPAGAPEAAAEEAPTADSAGAQETPAEEPEPEPAKVERNPNVKRVELVKATETKAAGIHEVLLKGDYNGIAYVQTNAMPSIGAVMDAVIVETPSRRDPTKTVQKIESFTVIA